MRPRRQLEFIDWRSVDLVVASGRELDPMRGNRLEITADVDEAGLAKLQEMLAKYAEILKMMN